MKALRRSRSQEPARPAAPPKASTYLLWCAAHSAWRDTQLVLMRPGSFCVSRLARQWRETYREFPACGMMADMHHSASVTVHLLVPVVIALVFVVLVALGARRNNR